MLGEVMGTLVLVVRCDQACMSMDKGFRQLDASLLSQATVERIRQLGLEMYDVKRFLTISMSPSFPPLLTLAMSPEIPVRSGQRIQGIMLAWQVNK
jgi:hypothetical protein